TSRRLPRPASRPPPAGRVADTLATRMMTMRVDRRSFVRMALQSVPAIGLAGASRGLVAASPEAATAVRARVWCEGPQPETAYPEGVGAAIGEILGDLPNVGVTRALLSDPAAGLSDEALEETDVLVWWGRLLH